MSIPLKPFAAILFAAGVLGTPSVLLAVGSSEASVNDTNETIALRNEMTEMRSELKSIKSQLKQTHHAKQVVHRKRIKHSSHYSTESNNTAVMEPADAERVRPFHRDEPGRSFVSIGPYVGLPYSYSGSNLIVNSPSVNIDVQLLNTRKNITRHLSTLGNLTTDAHPHLLLSGIIESQAIFQKFAGNYSSDIDVSNVSLDAILFGPSNWLLGFMELSYDGRTNYDTGTFRTANSRVYVNKAFATIGNFSETPFYASAGQFYVPFGSYSSIMVSDPLTKLLARTKARAVLAGFQQQDENNAFYGSIFGFKGDSGPHQNRLDNGGLNLGYRFKNNSIKGDIGGGVIANLADSVGMQYGGPAGGFSLNTLSEHLRHRVPAYDLRAVLSLTDHIDVLGEFISATRQFSPTDMRFNTHGAKPWAANLEASYSFNILCDKPSTVGLGFGSTGQALALGLPETRYSAVFNTSLLQHTLQSIEFRHDRLYGRSKTASIASSPAIVGEGANDNVVTLQFDYYF